MRLPDSKSMKTEMNQGRNLRERRPPSLTQLLPLLVGINLTLFNLHCCNARCHTSLFCALIFTTSDQPPSLPKLFRLKVHQEVAPHFKIFGTFLLNDETGSRVDSIKKACLGDPTDSVVSILQEWIAGRGKPLTWRTLIKTLRDCDLNPLAGEVEDFVAKL